MGTPPPYLKIKITKIGPSHVLSWPKLGLQAKFHDPGTFGDFEKHGQTDKPTRFMFYQYRYILLEGNTPFYFTVDQINIDHK